MKNVVVWGCGKYGQYLYKALRTFYKNTYLPVGMGDMRYAELNAKLRAGESLFADADTASAVRHIIGYHEIKDMFDSGKIDGVFIGVLDKDAYKKIEDSLSVMGIELFDLKSNDRIFAEEVAHTAYQTENGLITINILHDVFIFSNEEWSGNYRFSYLFTDSGRVFWETDRYLSLSSSPTDEIFLPYDSACTCKVVFEKAMSLLQIGADTNYGHFVFSCMGKICEMEKTGFDGTYLVYDSKFAREWMDIICEVYDIRPERIFWVNRYMEDKCFLVKELHCMQNIGDSSALNASILADFADSVLKYWEHSDSRREGQSYPSRVYLKRSGRRKLVGCDELLKRYDFVTVEPEKLSVRQQIMILNHADLVVAAHGAAVTNCLFMRKGTFLIETFGAGFIDAFFIEVIRERKINFRMLVAQKEYASYDLEEDYTIHPTLLEITLMEILERQASSNKHNGLED